MSSTVTLPVARPPSIRFWLRIARSVLTWDHCDCGRFVGDDGRLMATGDRQPTCSTCGVNIPWPPIETWP